MNRRFTACSPFRFVFGRKYHHDKQRRFITKEKGICLSGSNARPHLSSQMPLTTKVLSLFNLSAFLSWLSFLQSSKPVHLWSSNMRCLPQKWPLQKLQSPTMRCAGSLQSLCVQRIFFGAPPRKGRVMSMVADGGTLRDDRVELADEGGRWKRSAYGEKLAEGCYGGWWRDGQRYGWLGDWLIC